MTSEDDRIAELESRVEFQDETIAVLNDELVRHHARLSALEKQLSSLLEQLRQAREAVNPGKEPPPPHY